MAVNVGRLNGGPGPFLMPIEQAEASSKPARHNRPHIAVILPRGEAIRNFVYSGALDEVAREANISLLSVIPGKDVEALLEAACNRLLPLREIRSGKIVRNLREILDMAHGRWLWSKAAQERWLVHDAQSSGSRRLTRGLKKLACYAAANRPGLRFLSLVERTASHLLRTTDEYYQYFRESRPALVFNASHVHGSAALPAVEAAKALGIPTATFIFSWDNLTSQGRIVPQYDYYLVWNDAIQNQLLEIYETVKQEQVIVTGTPQFDFHFRREFQWTRREFCARVGADPQRPIVLYSTGMANHMPGEPKVVEGIANMLRTMKDEGLPQLLVRVYPKDHTGRFAGVRERNPDVLFPAIPWERAWLTPRIEDSYLLTNMLRHAAVGVNIASTVSLELCMFDKPVVNVGYNPPGLDISPIDFTRYYQFDHYQPLVKSGAVRVAWSESEMRNLLGQALRVPAADSGKRQSLIADMFSHRLDGYGGTRIAQCLIKLAETGRLAYA